MNNSPEKPRRAKRQKRSKARKHPTAHKIFMGIMTAFLSVILIGILSVSAVCGYVFVYIQNMVNGDMILDLNEYREDQSQTTIVYAYDQNNELVELKRLHGEINRIWVDYDDIPVNLRNAYIALEDKRFREHRGVDWLSIINIVAEERFARGGSTIDQQLVKNLTGESGRTFHRKFYEIVKALNLEANFSKEKILETYLNTLYLDAGCYGVETAAEYYFGKEVSELNLAECACLAAITKAPRDYNPILNYENNRTRMVDCLFFMKEQGLITEAEYEEARNYQLVFVGNSNAVRSKNDSSLGMDSNDVDVDNGSSKKSDIQSYYVDYVIDQVIDHLKSEYNMTHNQAWRKIYYGGLKIYTCVDLRVQSIMEEVYVNRIGVSHDDEDIQSAMAVVDYDGRLIGIVGQLGEKTANRCLNIAADSPRQPGSSIKPLSVYAPGIDGNYITWSSMIQNYGIPYNGQIWPYNYGGDPGSPGSYLSVRQAIAPSLNTVPAQLVKMMGCDYCYDYLTQKFHFTHLVESDRYYAPLAVGAMGYGVTCIEMAAAYATFGNGGKYFEPSSYSIVTNSDGGKIWLQRDTVGEQVIEPGTADVMQELLRTVVTSSDGTARKWYVDGITTIAKTGTTTDNKDSWFVGGTPYYMTAVWYGYSKNPRELKNIGGNSPSGRMFKTVMDRVHEGYEDKEFFKSGEAVQKYYCTGSGNLAGSGCTSTARGWFKADNLPGTCRGCYVEGAVVETESQSETQTNVTQPTNAQTPTSPPQTKPQTPSVVIVTDPPNGRDEPPATQPPAPVTNPPATQPPIVLEPEEQR